MKMRRCIDGRQGIWQKRQAWQRVEIQEACETGWIESIGCIYRSQEIWCKEDGKVIGSREEETLVPTTTAGPERLSKTYFKQHREALLSLDIEKIIEFAEQYNVNLPGSEAEIWRLVWNYFEEQGDFDNNLELRKKVLRKIKSCK
jgi:hypothetical protein